MPSNLQVRMLKKLHHDNIVELIDFWPIHGRQAIALEYCPHGNIQVLYWGWFDLEEHDYEQLYIENNKQASTDNNYSENYLQKGLV